ncbi:MAG: hypothetical protein ABI175_00240, partial [Polyangiales bacterium]
MARDGGAGVGAIVGVGLVLVAAIVIGAFVARMLGGPTNTVASSAPAPTHVDHGPPLSPDAAPSARPPLAFNDPDNAPRFEQTKRTVEALGKTVAAVSGAKDDVAEAEAKRACTAA